MKLNGTFTIREIAGEILVIPIGETALTMNGMIILNPVSKVIWECLEKESSADEILQSVLDCFEVEAEEAKADITEFLDELKKKDLLIGA